MNGFIMWLYGVSAEQAAARAPVMWFMLVISVVALLLLSGNALHDMVRAERKIARLEARVNRYRSECVQLEGQLDTMSKERAE